MSERSIEVFKQHCEAQQKYDYFIVGLSIALFAYTAKNFTAYPLGFNSSTIELLAIIAIFISVAAGLLRLENNLTIKANNFQKLYNQETKGKLTEALLQPGLKVNVETGDIFNPSLAKLQIETIDECNSEIDARLKKYQKLSEIKFTVRNWALLVGIFLLALSKVLESVLKTFIA